MAETDCKGQLMLVLTRRAGESIMIDNEIELKVLKIRGSQVHLGIDAPKKSAVHRKEVWLRIHGEPAAAPASPKFDEKGYQSGKARSA
jgi:carbon storage regulator